MITRLFNAKWTCAFSYLASGPIVYFRRKDKTGSHGLDGKKRHKRGAALWSAKGSSVHAHRAPAKDLGEMPGEKGRHFNWSPSPERDQMRDSPWSLRHLITRLWRNKGKLNFLRKQVKMIVIAWCSILAALKPRRYFFQVIQKKTIKPWNQGKSRFQNLISSNKISGALVNYRRQIWLPYWKIPQSSIYAD